MNIMTLLRKIFSPKYTDRTVDEITTENTRKMREAAASLDKDTKRIRGGEVDIGLKVWIATGGKREH
jgi:hypothetical protein